MSFAGPYDPLLQLAMRNAAAKGVILIAASGNMGPQVAAALSGGRSACDRGHRR